MRRWFLRIFLSLIIAILIFVSIVQVVLWTPLPKRLVLARIEAEMGLRISAASLSTSWLGTTELKDVSLGLPLSSADFLKVKSLKIKHGNLIGLALGRVELESIQIDDPVVDVVQNAQGQWNLQQVIELLKRVGGGTGGQNSPADPGIPRLPTVTLVNGSVHVTDSLGQSVALEPVNLTGRPSGALVWQYHLTIADSVDLTGRVAPGGNWHHQVVLSVQNLDRLLKSWGAPTSFAAVLKSSWEGQITNGMVTGVLTIQQASASQVPALGDVKIDGSVRVQINGPVVALQPNPLDLKMTNPTLPDLQIEAGSIVADAAGLHAHSIGLRALGGLAKLDANYDPATDAADLQARWSGLSLAKKTTQSGSMTAQMTQQFKGQPVIVVDVIDAGSVGGTAPSTAPASQWNANLNLTGRGSSWKNIDWVLTAPQLTYATARRTIDLSQMSAHVSQHLPVVELTSLSMPPNGTTPANLNSTGRIEYSPDYQSSHWTLQTSGGLNTTFEETPVPITFALQADGSSSARAGNPQRRVNLKAFTLGLSDLTFSADGFYDSKVPTPVDLNLQLTQAPRVTPDAPVQGEVSGDFKIKGDLFKDDKDGRFRPYLTTTGDLRSSDLVVFNRPVGDIDLKLQGEIQTPNLLDGEPGPAITRIHTINFSLFQAPWDFAIDYPNAKGNLEATLQTRELELEELGKFANVKKSVRGLVNARWTAVLSSAGLSSLDLQSEYHLIDLNAFGFNADTVDATVTIRNGLLKLNHLVAKSGSGSIITNASLDLNDRRHLVSDTTVDRWPTRLSPTVTAISSARCPRLDLDLKAKDLGAHGSITASTDLVLGETTRLAHADASVTVNNRTISLDEMAANFFAASCEGTAKVDLDKPLQATGRIVCDNLDGGALAAVWPQLDGLGGRYSFTITLVPVRDPRPLEPVRVDLNLASTDGHFRSLQIGNNKALLTAHAVGYLNTDRAVLDHSDIFLAGGIAHLWGAVAYRPDAGVTDNVWIEGENFQLDQLARMDPKRTKPMPGLLSFGVNMIRSGSASNQVLAQARANLSQADLGDFGPIAALYGLMHVGGRPGAGSGVVDLSFQQNVLRVTNFQYFNQGIEARGLCSLGPIDYDNLKATPINGQVVGTARPLKNTKLPFLSDFDTIFNAFQGSLTTVNIVGTVAHPAYPQALVTDIGKTLRELLVGEAEGGNAD